LIPVVDYMSVEEQVDVDFVRARRKAILRKLAARLRRDPTSGRLSCFEEVRRKLGAAGGLRRGRSVVRLADIVGSVGQCAEFDGAFLPASRRARTRWQRIDRAFHRGEELPPVSLYRIDEEYFVEDGNHRVSVYRYHGVEWIDAEVTEFRTQLPKKQKGRRLPDEQIKGCEPRRPGMKAIRTNGGGGRAKLAGPAKKRARKARDTN
jgi:hypothetical protein